ncbi:hypothetical protein DID77_02810 [Candidatus Marinamargulisbacteria bacterium SCGC AG-439-L15]|nr:hypothetical protein DID77_02810 [Candidatus Marinamargulisbacteria bacterium SCGC AG-439-L15]
MNLGGELVCIGGIASCFGSFFNCLIYRLPRGISLLKASHCPRCKRPLKKNAQLIPILSYFRLHRRCYWCFRPIPLHYLGVESLTVLIWVGVYYQYGLSIEGVSYLVFFSAILVLSALDLAYYWVPDSILCSLFLLGVGSAILRAMFVEAMIGLIGATVLFWGISVVSQAVYKRPVIGDGDIKLLGVIGLFFGLEKAILCLYFSFILGGILAFFLLLLKYKKRTDRLPFVPVMGLSMGSVLCLL